MAAALILVLAAAIVDARTGRIPNRLTLTGLVAGLLAGLAAVGPVGLAVALASALAAGLVPFLLFRAGAMGGGDVKLLAALGALLGAGGALELEMLAFAVGALQGLWMWLRAGTLAAGLKGAARLALRPLVGPGSRGCLASAGTPATVICFGPAVLAATVAIAALALAGRA
ncbi:MAG: A24 family peptidase [Deltaproteobacteria bacterium]|nr:A24 family peptidase [Deltaproteobacteria bacterium]